MQRRARIGMAVVCLLAGVWGAGVARAAEEESFARSRGARERLGTLKNLSNTPSTHSQHPVVAVAGKHVYVAWTEFISSEGSSRVLLRVSHDGGRSFGGPKRLNAPGSAGRDVALLADGSRVYVAWLGDGVHFRVSRDRGGHFGPTLTLNEDGRGGSPILAATGNHVYVAWNQDIEDRDLRNLFFRASHDGGRSFGPVLDINDERGSGGTRVVAEGRNVYIVWDDGFDSDGARVFFRRSTNRGDSFEPIQVLSRSTDYDSHHVRLAVSDDDLFLTWMACVSPFPGRPTPCEVLFRRSTDEGASFGSTVALSDTSGVYPEIAAEDDNVYVTWQGGVGGNDEILLRKSDDRGASFAPSLNVSQTPGLSSMPRISAEDDFVRVVWEDETTPAFPDIYYSASHDEGESFLPAVNLSANAGASRYPQLAATEDGERVHFVWQDDSPPGSFDIPEVLYRHAEED